MHEAWDQCMPASMGILLNSSPEQDKIAFAKKSHRASSCLNRSTVKYSYLHRPATHHAWCRADVARSLMHELAALLPPSPAQDKRGGFPQSLQQSSFT